MRSPDSLSGTQTINATTPNADTTIAGTGPKDLFATLHHRISLEGGGSLEGQQLSHYILLEELGRGGMGVVYAAYDRRLDRKVAIKLVRTSNDELLHRRLVREAKAMAKITHPNVVQVYEIHESERASFIVMEYVKGVTLRQWLAQSQRNLSEIVDTYAAAGRGLLAIHEVGLTHRDFKPDNVMVRESGQVLVMDLGVAHGELAPMRPVDLAVLEESLENLTRTGALVGSPRYMAPEQLQGLACTPRSDQFSFCVSLWEAVYGSRPFAGNTFGELFEAVTSGSIDAPKRAVAPAWLRRVLDRGLRTEPRERFESMAELLHTLAVGERSTARARTWRQLGGLAGVGVLALGAVLAGRAGAESEARPGTLLGDGIDQFVLALPPTTDRQELIAFARLYGYVRHFHPSDAAAKADWDALALAGAHEVVQGNSQAELQTTLQQFFEPYAPTLRIYHEGEAAPDIELTGEGPSVAWQHLGYGQGFRGEFESKRTARSGSADAWAPIVSSVDARPLRGKTLRMQARVRVDEGEHGQAQLWMRVDRDGGQMGFFDNMGDRPIRSGHWATYTIEGEVAHDATRIAFGGLVQRDATGYFDDFSLSVIDGERLRPVEIENPDFEGGDTKGWAETVDEFDYAVIADAGGQVFRLRRKLELFEGVPEMGEFIDLPLGAGLRARMPIVLPDSLAQQSGPVRTYTAPEAGDPAHARGAVIVAWNVVQHFHPYIDEDDRAWDAALVRALDDAADDHDPEATQRTLERMFAQVGDGQLMIDGPLEWATVPARFVGLDGKVFVVDAKPGTSLQRGDEILAVDGVAIDEALAEARTRVGGTAQRRDELLLGQAGITRGTERQKVALTLQRGGEIRELEVERVAYWQDSPDPNSAIRHLEDGLVYVDMDQLPGVQFERRLPELAAAPGVVFDLRGQLPRDVELLGHLLTAPDEVDRDFVPQVIHPDHQDDSWQGSHEKTRTAMPHIGGTLVFIVDASSSAEGMIARITDHGIGEIVGSPTGGADGQVSSFVVPGGFEVMFTASLSKRRDGSALHESGIVPTVPVELSSAAFQAGRDEALEVALSIARERE